MATVYTNQLKFQQTFLDSSNYHFIYAGIINELECIGRGFYAVILTGIAGIQVGGKVGPKFLQLNGGVCWLGWSQAGFLWERRPRRDLN